MNLFANGETYTWTYNTGGALGGQTSYAFKFTCPAVNGGNPQWWTGAAWSSTETFVTSTATTLTLGSADWVVAYQDTTCLWTVNTGDANGHGVAYATALTLISEGPPSAPTLTTPVSGTYFDLLTPTFKWNYNPTNVTSGQTNWAFRQKSTGAYTYWNATSLTWSGTIVWNAGATVSYAFPSGAFANGSTYNWSVASQDDGGQGAFAADATVTAHKMIRLIYVLLTRKQAYLDCGRQAECAVIQPE